MDTYEKFHELSCNKSLELGNVYLNKGTILHMMNRLDEARWYYEQAHVMANGENMREQIEQLIDSMDPEESRRGSEDLRVPMDYGE